MLMGKMRASAGAESRDGEKGKMPLPFVVLISGNTAMTRCGFCSTRARSVVRLVGEDGDRVGGDSATNMARKRDTRWTLRVPGYDMVKMGSKMAAR